MQTVTVSPKFQVVIPSDARKSLHLRPGQKMRVLEYEGRIELIADLDIAEPRGFLKGINTDFVRDKVVLRESSANEALQVVAAMQKGTVVDLTSKVALAASKLGLRHALPMADSIILATARPYNAVIWTQDSDFESVSDVRYFSKN